MTSKKARKRFSLPKFKVGDRVRVKPGVTDVDYPDMPLGGWAGTVVEVSGTDTFDFAHNVLVQASAVRTDHLGEDGKG